MLVKYFAFSRCNFFVSFLSLFPLQVRNIAFHFFIPNISISDADAPPCHMERWNELWASVGEPTYLQNGIYNL